MNAAPPPDSTGDSDEVVQVHHHVHNHVHKSELEGCITGITTAFLGVVTIIITVLFLFAGADGILNISSECVILTLPPRVLIDTCLK
jgi:hypothetical protein